MKCDLFKIIILCVLSVILIGCSGKGKPGVESEKVREYANALYNRELYPQAIREYQRYLDLYPLSEQHQGNINFIIGNIYFERLYDYENAMAYFLKV